MGAGAALNIGGGILSRNEATKNAERQAAARNAVLADNIAKQQGFFGENKGVWDANIANYAQPAQEQRLQTAQDTRGANNAGNITQVDPSSIPTQMDASPAVKSEIAKRMLASFTSATDRAKNVGKLSGYGDAWLQNQIDNKQADRDIGVTNQFSAGRKALLDPEQDAAAAAAYKQPSIWGPVLQGAGSVMSAAGGAGGFGGAPAAPGAGNPMWGGGVNGTNSGGWF